MKVRFSLERNLLAYDIQEEIQLKEALGIHGVCIPLFHPRLMDSLESNCDPLTRSDRLIEYQAWSNFYVRISEWIDLGSSNKEYRLMSIARFERELSYAAHLGIPVLLLPTPKSSPFLANYGRYLSSYLSGLPHSVTYKKRFLISLPFIAPLAWQFTRTQQQQAEGEEEEDENDEEEVENDERRRQLISWQCWNSLRNFLHPSLQVGVCLEFSSEFEDFVDFFYHKDLPTLDSFLRTWIAEPLQLITIPTTTFVFNSHGYPVLSKPIQHVIKTFFRYSIDIQLRGKSYFSSSSSSKRSLNSLPPGLGGGGAGGGGGGMEPSLKSEAYEEESYLPYFHYLKFLCKKAEEELFQDTPELKMCSSYFDVLQIPLQPLMDNLESITYETFEKDPVKYSQYEEAILKSLFHIKQRDQSDLVTVMVVGAGRGPLIAATLSASHQSGIPVRIYAVEKNPNAIITLRNRMVTECWDPSIISIISKDMRKFYCEHPCDLIVSELLGSFGDNELSPECLYSTEHNLHPGSISIPSKYTSYLQPITCPILHQNAFNLFSHDLSQPNFKGLETPFVVYLRRFLPLDEPKACWSFHHPSWLQNNPDSSRSERYSAVEFESQVSSNLHGFAGYFDTNLFEDEVMLSIVPETQTKNMFSWFPIFFPLIQPVWIEKGQKIVFQIWR